MASGSERRAKDRREFTADFGAEEPPKVIPRAMEPHLEAVARNAQREVDERIEEVYERHHKVELTEEQQQKCVADAVSGLIDGWLGRDTLNTAAVATLQESKRVRALDVKLHAKARKSKASKKAKSKEQKKPKLDACTSFARRYGRSFLVAFANASSSALQETKTRLRRTKETKSEAEVRVLDQPIGLGPPPYAWLRDEKLGHSCLNRLLYAMRLRHPKWVEEKLTWDDFKGNQDKDTPSLATLGMIAPRQTRGTASDDADRTVAVDTVYGGLPHGAAGTGVVSYAHRSEANYWVLKTYGGAKLHEDFFPDRAMRVHRAGRAGASTDNSTKDELPFGKVQHELFEHDDHSRSTAGRLVSLPSLARRTCRSTQDAGGLS